MRVGIVATEFPPKVGGMEQHAFGLASALAKSDIVTVYTAQQNMLERPPSEFLVKPILYQDVSRDAGQLQEERLDVFLTLNGGYAALGQRLSTPVVCFLHGNDFLNPWISQDSRYSTFVSSLVHFFRSKPLARCFRPRRRRAAARRRAWGRRLAYL